ncbi:MAG: hypothetical protein JHC31_04335 [Sulfurihydrogenibium sp.]|jgi:hypothetical protein|nr:hypothetical protein [Sulfurihydrogenibium sp.]
METFEFGFEKKLKEYLGSFNFNKIKVSYDFVLDVGALDLTISSTTNTDNSLKICVYPTIEGRRLIKIDNFKERVTLTSREVFERIVRVIEAKFKGKIKWKRKKVENHMSIREKGFIIIDEN